MICTLSGFIMADTALINRGPEDGAADRIILTWITQTEQVKENEMGGACSANGGEDECI
jgi:hypothetical protein